MPEGSNDNNILQTGLLSVAIGLILLLISIHLTSTAGELSPWNQTTLRLTESLGIGAILFGGFTLIADTKAWRQFFEDRLRSLVIGRSYLSTLDDRELGKLLGNVLKAQSDDPNLDTRGSFLRYFHDHLHQFIFKPYRESLDATFTFRDRDDEKGLTVSARITFTLRAVSGRVNDHVGFSFEPEELESFKQLKVEAQLPSYHEDDGGLRGTIATVSEIDEVGDGTLGATVNIPPTYKVDGTKVIIDARYNLTSNHIQYWWSFHPTRGVTITVDPPVGYEVRLKPFVQHPDLCIGNGRGNPCKISYDSWMLPNNGFAWQMFEAGTVDPLRGGETQETQGEASGT